MSPDVTTIICDGVPVDVKGTPAEVSDRLERGPHAEHWEGRTNADGQPVEPSYWIPRFVIFESADGRGEVRVDAGQVDIVASKGSV